MSSCPPSVSSPSVSASAATRCARPSPRCGTRGWSTTRRGRGGGTGVTVCGRARQHDRSVRAQRRGDARRVDFRRVVEPGAAWLAATQPLAGDQRAWLTEVPREVDEALDAAAHRVADSRLHLAVATLSGSPMLDRRRHPVAGGPARHAHGDPGAAGATSSTPTPSTTRSSRPSSAGTRNEPGGHGGALRCHLRTAPRPHRLRRQEGTTWRPHHAHLDQLRAEIESGDIDTVVVAFTDMQGRLQGKRLHGHYFLDHVLEDGTEGCNYLLAVDVDMNTVDGYAISSWERGYGDMFFDLDLDTLRRTPGSLTPRPCSATSRGSTAAAPSRSRPGRCSRRRSTGPRTSGWRRTAAPSSSSSSSRSPTSRRGTADYTGLTPAQPLQRRLLDPRRRPRRAAAARDPQRDVCRRAPSSRAPRASATTASTRSASSSTRRCARATTTSSTATPPRRSRPTTGSR